MKSISKTAGLNVVSVPLIADRLISTFVIQSERDGASRPSVSRRTYTFFFHLLKAKSKIHLSFFSSSRIVHAMRLLLFTLILAFPLASSAHVNSPDVYYDGYAGKYHLLVTITPPPVVPGIAQIQIRCADSDLGQIKVLPLKMVGVAAELAPTPDVAERSQTDPQLFHGKLWIMTRGSWKIQIQAEGSKGP
ncbi:MAG TPA: hypothetical protein VFW31_13955, partial [Candidatus Angelobacter sp.]|nr:hypothetical protein [Candidatus Angelobacter sp.]